MGRCRKSQPFPALVDKAPFAILANRSLATLKLPGIVESRLDNPVLPFIDEAPASALHLSGREPFAVGTDVAVFWAGTSAGAEGE